VATDSLRNRVSGLVQAMASFNAGGTGSAAQGLTLPDLSETTAKTGLMSAVGSMVDVMKQFDANGSRMPSGAASMASTAESLAKSVSQPATTGLLTTNSSLK
jgi:hypothetical protein